MTQPIVILGIQPRSGTNYLSGLLCLHPDCSPPAGVPEDHLLAGAGHLVAYDAAQQDVWRARYRKDVTETLPDLLPLIGAGLLGSLSAHCPAPRLVTKTPSVENLHLVPRLFACAHLILLVRDGRAVVESRMRSWPDDGDVEAQYDRHARAWAAAADTILNFRRTVSPLTYPYLVVRYEDLFRRTEPTMRMILDFAGLPQADFDFGAAESLPVRGSSTYGRPGWGSAAPGAVHWQSVPRTGAFDPIGRAADWPEARHRRFNALAASQLEAFGYAPEPGR